MCEVFPQNSLSAQEEKTLGIMRSVLVEEAFEAIWEVVGTVGGGTSEGPQGQEELNSRQSPHYLLLQC